MIIKNITVVLENEVIKHANVVTKDGIIKEITTNIIPSTDYIDGTNKILFPGFIDGHTHGAIGHDFMDNTKESLNAMLDYLPSEGVTSVLATTMSQDLDVLKDIVNTISTYQADHVQTKIAGIHLEGPFFNKEKLGAQNPDYIINPDVEALKHIQGEHNSIKVITYAPELDEDFKFTKYLIKNNIRGSLGHSSANLNTCNKCLELSNVRATHLFNAMNPFHHRDTGIVNASFVNKMLSEIIVDKFHVHPDVVKVAFQVLDSHHLILISDSMRAKGLGDGIYELGGQEVIVKNGHARVASGAIAGSTLKYDNGVKNMYEITQCTILDLANMTSMNQSRDLNLDTGIIKKGFKADFVIMDKELNIETTIINGSVVYTKS